MTPKEKTIEKVIRNGKVAVLVSEAWVAGWYSWNKGYKELLFHPKLVEMVEQGRNKEITREWVKENLGIDIFAGGAKGLRIHWLPVGTKFYISESDGTESLEIINNISITA